MKSKKGFLLFEVTLTIAILSIGLVFIVRSISSSMKAAGDNFNYSKAINLTYNKLFELELQSQATGIEKESDQGKFSGQDKFGWEYSKEKLEDSDIYKLTLYTYWKEASREAGFSIYTYFDDKE